MVSVDATRAYGDGTPKTAQSQADHARSYTRSAVFRRRARRDHGAELVPVIVQSAAPYPPVVPGCAESRSGIFPTNGYLPDYAFRGAASKRLGRQSMDRAQSLQGISARQRRRLRAIERLIAVQNQSCLVSRAC